ncbi:hypothetical protein RGQ29_023300 [Quercus rubra]|uniref:DUF7722 domain-containing protein n=1 Tax=Quercus rubra TaxID=3512 RepID=A0AAN7ITI3_QUERU|nr:hypothetical protein RGQ29_023300 [Quercus rubra]
MESVSRTFQKIGNGGPNGLHTRERCEDFQMPLHYLTMLEGKLDCFLRDYGLPIIGDVDHKRMFAMGSFLWPH